MTVAEVVGALSTDALSQRLADRCKATIITVDSEKRHINMGKATPRVIKVDFPVLPSHREERVAELGRRDSYLDAMIAAAGERFTVIYATTPPSSEQLVATQHKTQVVYEMDESYPEAYHMDLKRDVSSHADNNTASKLPLFEKYQFLSSGKFAAKHYVVVPERRLTHHAFRHIYGPFRQPAPFHDSVRGCQRRVEP